MLLPRVIPEVSVHNCSTTERPTEAPNGHVVNTVKTCSESLAITRFKYHSRIQDSLTLAADVSMYFSYHAWDTVTFKLIKCGIPRVIAS